MLNGIFSIYLYTISFVSVISGKLYCRNTNYLCHEDVRATTAFSYFAYILILCFRNMGG